MAARKQSTSQPKPSEPVVDLGARQVTFWFPSITMPDGTVVRCEHQRYGHESEAAAKRCLRSLQWRQQAAEASKPAEQPKPTSPAAKLRSGSQGVTAAA
jgi:hypothetical protein